MARAVVVVVLRRACSRASPPGPAGFRLAWSLGVPRLGRLGNALAPHSLFYRASFWGCPPSPLFSAPESKLLGQKKFTPSPLKGLFLNTRPTAAQGLAALRQSFVAKPSSASKKAVVCLGFFFGTSGLLLVLPCLRALKTWRLAPSNRQNFLMPAGRRKRIPPPKSFSFVPPVGGQNCLFLRCIF